MMLPSQETIEFYQGWMIELAEVEEVFCFFCHSPFGESLTDYSLHLSHRLALQAAFQLINQFLACAALRGVLREVFESEMLAFDEWQTLAQSLDYVARGQFMRSPSERE